MVRKICLDSDIIISLLNSDAPTIELIRSLEGNFYTTPINTFEVWYGRKKQEKAFHFLESLHTINFDNKSARLAADILRELEKKGQVLDLKDVLVAALCITNDIELLTYNKKHFERLKNFGLILV